MQVSTVVNIASALCAFIAGVQWWKASRVIVPMSPRTSGIAIGLQSGGSMDIFATAQESARLNARAAITAAFAAILQGGGLLLAVFNN